MHPRYPSLPATVPDADWQALRAHQQGALPPVARPSDWHTIYRGVLGPPRADRPRVVGHIAQTIDGFIATSGGSSQWISGAQDLDHTHRLRVLCDAVLVGACTVTLDNPRLTVRRADGAHPIRVVLDPRLRCPATSHVFNDGAAPTWVFSGDQGPRGSDRVGLAKIHRVQHSAAGQLDLRQVLAQLHQQGVRRVLVEGGGRTIAGFAEGELLDRLHLVLAPTVLGTGRPGVGSICAPPDGPAMHITPYRLGGDILLDCVPQ